MFLNLQTAFADNDIYELPHFPRAVKTVHVVSLADMLIAHVTSLADYVDSHVTSLADYVDCICFERSKIKPNFSVSAAQ